MWTSGKFSGPFICRFCLGQRSEFQVKEVRSGVFPARTQEAHAKWADKTNCPQPMPATFSSRERIGGNAHENWALIRLLPLIIGHRIPLNDPAWLLLMSLKDIIELLVAPVHNEESIAYLDSKIWLELSKKVQESPSPQI